MYYNNITNTELLKFPKPYVPNFSIKLTDIIHKTEGTFDNLMFNIEEIITDNIYRIYPLFNCKTIQSTNINDRIFENRLIIAKKEQKETYITFITNENEEVQDYSNYGNYYSITDELTTSEYNSIVSLIRANNSINQDLHIQNSTVETDYGNYDFNFEGLILDNGIEIINTTNLKVKLSNQQLHYSTYTLKLQALRISNTNIEDDDNTNNKTIIPVNVVLKNNEWVDVDISNLEIGDIILYNCSLTINHDIPVIQDWIKTLELFTEPNIIQSGDNMEIYCTGFDIGGVPVGAGHTIYFFEEYTPQVLVDVSDSIIESGDTSTMKISLKDSEDGSLISLKGATVKIYEEYTPNVVVSSSNPVIQTGDTTDVKITLKDGEDGSIVSLDGATVKLYEEYTPSLVLNSDKSIIQTNEQSDIFVTVKDSEDGSLVADETVYFYVKEE